MIVVDASLAVKWVLWEPDSLQALDFLVQRDRELCAPDLLFIEGGGCDRPASKHVKGDGSGHATGCSTRTEKVDDDMGATWFKTYRITQRRLYRAGTLALSLGHPIKDCIYLGLAMEIGADLATCDAKFRHKGLQLYSAIRLLNEFDT